MTEKYFVAKSYEKMTKIGNPFLKNGKLYIKVKDKCDRCCNGIYAIGTHNGQLVPHPNANGICFKCGGSGFITKDVRLYTEKEFTSMQHTAERREQKIKKEKEIKEQKLLNESENNKKEWLIHNGFSIEGFCYCIYGGNTYSIKDQLKELGCHYDSIMKWYAAAPLKDLPTQYLQLKIQFEDIFIWHPLTKTATYKENAAITFKKLISQQLLPSTSEYIGKIKERFYNKKVTIVDKRYFLSQFGYTNIFTFEDENKNVLVWFTQKDYEEFNINQPILLTATIKNYNEYEGVKQTIITRCKITTV